MPTRSDVTEMADKMLISPNHVFGGIHLPTAPFSSFAEVCSTHILPSFSSVSTPSPATELTHNLSFLGHGGSRFRRLRKLRLHLITIRKQAFLMPYKLQKSEGWHFGKLNSQFAWSVWTPKRSPMSEWT